MTDREKVIKGLECCSDAVLECGENCPYWNIENCQSSLQDDALALLKAQEVVVHARWITYPECLGYDGAYHDEHIVCSACHSVWNIIDNDTERFDHCPACGARMDGMMSGRK